MDYELLQDAIVEKLTPFAAADISIVRLPEKESEKTQTKPNDVKFTVIYAGSEYSETTDAGQVVQNEKVFIQILVESTLLYGPRGIYNLVSVLKKYLTGFKYQGLKPLQVSKHHTTASPDAEKKNNMWQYQVIFQTFSLHVEDFTEDISVLLKKITFIDKPDNETFVVPEPTEE